MTEYLLFGFAGLAASAWLLAGYAASRWAANNRRPVVALFASLSVLAAATAIGMLLWLADGYLMVHRQAASYGHQWTPEPPPGTTND